MATSFSGISLEELKAINDALDSGVTNKQCKDGECTLCGDTCTGKKCSNTSCVGSCGYIEIRPKYEGRIIERTFNYLKDQVLINKQSLLNSNKILNAPKGVANRVYIGGSCGTEGEKNWVNDNCYECIKGRWYYVNNGQKFKSKPTVSFTGSSSTKLEQNNFRPKLASSSSSDEENDCNVKPYKPIRYTSGKVGVKCTQEYYPETINCECEPVFGDWAGENLRLAQIPSASKEPHFFSFSKGVPNQYDLGNSEFKDAYVVMIGPRFSNITFPENPPKPLCKETPYTINYVERTEGNKSVVGSALMHSCFKGTSGGEDYAIPKHAVNSFEFFDRFIEPSGESTFRGGQRLEGVGSYVLHSPDLHMRKPILNATTCLIEMEISGDGFRHGMISEGEEPESPRQDKLNQKGTRQAVNMNKWTSFGQPIVRNIKALSEAKANGIVPRGENFTYPLVNLHRESSVYMELEGGLQEFTKSDAERGMSGKYGGIDNVGDNASDRSFTGDTYTESIPLFENRAHYCTLKRNLPSQYGSPIRQAFIPLGLYGNEGESEVYGLVGDTHVGSMSYKRTAVVSDKTNRIISRLVGVGGFADQSSIVARVVGNIFAYMFRTLGIRNGGYVPKTQDPDDYIRVYGGLRSVGEGNPGEVIEGQIPEPYGNGTSSTGKDVNFGDNYFFGNVKTLITSFFSSDVNLHYRQLNDKENGELYYSQNPYTLKGLNIDSNIPEDSEWGDGWINRWYQEWKENARWKLIVQAIILFLFSYGIGIYIMWEGFSYAIEGISAIGGGSMGLRSVGGTSTIILAVLIIMLGVIWIKYWSRVDMDNKFVEEWMKLKNIRPDKRNQDGSYSFDNKRYRQFENNYWKYDFTHSLNNSLEVSYGLPDPYDTCSCPTRYTNEIVYSNKQNMDSLIDFWRNYKPYNDLEIPTTHGQLSKMFVFGNTLYAHTTDMLMKIFRGRSGSATDEASLMLGDGALFGGVADIYGGPVEGYAGLKDPLAAEVTSYGYFFPDRDARKWYRFNGELPTPISDFGVNRYMANNMEFKLLNHFPDFKLVDLKLPGGIGYSFGVDHNKNIAYFTKIDYEPRDSSVKMNADGTGFNFPFSNTDKWLNKSFTLSMNLASKDSEWLSFHSMTPHLYTWNRFDMYSFNGKEMYIHNVAHKFLNFYGKFHPASIDIHVNDAHGEQPSFDSFHYKNTAIDAEAFQYRDYDYKPINDTFNKGFFYNSRQSTGMKNLILDQDVTYYEKNKHHHDIITNLKGRLWKIEKLNDYVEDEEGHILEERVELGPRKPNNGVLSSSVKRNTFYDNYLVNRLIFDKFDNIKIILKKLKTVIDVKNEQ